MYGFGVLSNMASSGASKTFGRDSQLTISASDSDDGEARADKREDQIASSADVKPSAICRWIRKRSYSLLNLVTPLLSGS